MAVQRDPITEQLLNVYEVHQNRRQAEMDLEDAETRESITSRSAVPTVFAQLQEREEKKNAAAEKIAKQGTGSAQPAVAPPMVDVSGRTGGRDGAALAKIGEGLSGVANGGGGLGADTPGAPAVGNAPGASAGGIAEAPLQGAPGGVIENKIPVSGVQRALSGLGALLSAKGAPGQLVELGTQAITGERTVGFSTAPTAIALADREAPGLALLQTARARARTPEDVELTTKAYLDRLSELKTKYGEYAGQIVPEAERRASDLRLAEAEKRLIATETAEAANQRLLDRPSSQRAARWNEIEEKVQNFGVESLTPGERAIFEGKKRSTNITIQNGMTTATRTARTKQLDSNYDLLQSLDAVDEHFNKDFFTRQSQWAAWWKDQGARLDMLNPKEREELLKFNQFQKALAGFTLEKLMEGAGKAMTNVEISRIEAAYASMRDNPDTAEASLKMIREGIALSTMRLDMFLHEDDPTNTHNWAEMRSVAADVANNRIGELVSQGLPEADAVQRTSRELKQRYGLDFDYTVMRGL